MPKSDLSKSDDTSDAQGLKPPSQPKLHCFIARQTFCAVVLYRRRNKETWVFKINYANKNGQAKTQIKKGARFNGRFYPSRCDLSPDGKHFSYFVMGGYQKVKRREDQLYCWNAMSKPPALTAEFLLPQHDTWGGGSIFYDNENLLVSAGMYSTQDELAKIHGKNWHGVKVWIPGYTQAVPDELANRKPMSDGWHGDLERNMVAGEWSKQSGKGILVRSFRKDWIKCGGFRALEYQLFDTNGERLLDEEKMQAADWADFDLLGRLWLGCGTRIEIFNNPRNGMSEKPSRVIDLEAHI